jgi:hypothetical protein
MHKKGKVSRAKITWADVIDTTHSAFVSRKEKNRVYNAYIDQQGKAQEKRVKKLRSLS